MKTSMKQLAAGTFIALLLLVGNAKAEGTEIKFSHRVSIETTLQLESWMTDETVWNTNSIYNEFVQETETSMELENWMTSEETWNLNSNFDVETETGLELENWMTNEETWNSIDLNVDSELSLENWMINSDIWK